MRLTEEEVAQTMTRWVAEYLEIPLADVAAMDEGRFADAREEVLLDLEERMWRQRAAEKEDDESE